MKNEINGKLIPNKNIGKSYQFINNQIKLCFYLIIFNFVFTNISCYKTIRIEGSGLCIIDKKYIDVQSCTSTCNGIEVDNKW